MFETQKVRRYDKFRKEWSQHKNKCKSQMGQDQVSGGISVFCWLAAPQTPQLIVCFLKNLQLFCSIQQRESGQSYYSNDKVFIWFMKYNFIHLIKAIENIPAALSNIVCSYSNVSSWENFWTKVDFPTKLSPMMVHCKHLSLFSRTTILKFVSSVKAPDVFSRPQSI